MAKVIKFKTELTDEELWGLIRQYGTHYDRKFRHIWKLHAEKEEIIGKLSIAACEARNKYRTLKEKRSTMRTYIIGAFRNCMNNYKDYLYVRQVKYRMARITKC